MARTLHRPPAGETPHELDFLKGIDLEGEHRRPRVRITRSWLLIGAGLLVLLAAIIVTIVLTGDGTTTGEYVDSGHRPVTYDVEATSPAHDSWMEPAIAAYHVQLDAMYDSGHRPLRTDVAAPVVHDGWMGPAIEAYRAQLDALYDSGHRPIAMGSAAPYDSLIATALTRHEAVLAAAHDSGIAQAIAARDAALAQVHDSEIAALLRER
jgi:hypothetical protein